MSHEEIFVPESLQAAAVVEAIRENGACARPMLREAFVASLLDEASRAPYRRGREVIGTGAAAVRQDLSYCEQFPTASLFRVLTRRFQALLEGRLGALDSYPFGSPLVFNDLMLQHYAAQGLGISAHRDETRYINLACIFVLEGGGGFYVCEDRQGRGAVEIVAPPGSAIFLRCPGLRAASGRVFHYVAGLDAPRTTFGLRHDRKLEPGLEPAPVQH